MITSKQTSWINDLTGVTDIYQDIESNFAFVAIEGTHFNGNHYIEQAIKRGACAIITSHITEQLKNNHPTIHFIQTKNPRRYLAKLASNIYHPIPKTIMAVTGTNGKTSITYIASQLWMLLGHKSATIGTLGFGIMNSTDSISFHKIPQNLTTPSAPYIYKTLQKLAKKHVQWVALEASSHGLDMHRLDELPIHAAAFSNLTLEHLDYHKSMEHYKASKLRLFQELLPMKHTAVINCESHEFAEIESIASRRHLNLISYGMLRGSLHYINYHPNSTGFDVEIECYGERISSYIPLLGNFQLYNTLAAIGLVMSCEAPFKRILEQLPYLQNIPGRLERITTVKNRTFFIDFAHTPDALYQSLISLRQHYKEGRIILVFGCGGNRDKQKRSVMGKIANDYADVVIITNDNPRMEDPASIRKDILKHAPRAIEVDNRKKAIIKGIHLLHEKDCLLVAGKGHEQFQIIQQQSFPFDEKAIIQDEVRLYFS